MTDNLRQDTDNGLIA